MDELLIYSLIIIALVGAVVVFLAVRSPLLFKIGIRNFVKRKKSSALAICGLLVGSAIISGSLAVGDSMENAIVQSAYENLGEVDELVHSLTSFNRTLFDSLKNDAILDSLTDGIAPLIVLPVSVTNPANGLRESRSTVFGYNRDLFHFGDFLTAGPTYNIELGPGQAIIDEKLADTINVQPGQNITLSFRSPEYSIETVYSELRDLILKNLTVSAVVRDESLGRLKLGSGSGGVSNVFVNLTHLQDTLELKSGINTVIVSNNGGIEDGVELTDAVSQRIETILNDDIGYRDLGFLVLPVTDYVKIENSDIFFQERYLDLVESAAGSSALIDAVSPLASYFVNTIVSGNVSIYYSVVTGFEPDVDSEFGLFTENGTGLGIVGEIEDDEIIITNYTANRLGIGVGSSITLNYSTYDETYREKFGYENFTVRYIVDITGKADDEEIMPPFPGIKGTDSCGDWDPPVDSFDRDLMEWEDLDYWVMYHGTPKAYITLDKAQELWTNDLGNLTTIKVKPSAGVTLNTLASDVGGHLNLSIGYKDASISVSGIKQDGIRSAEGVQLLTETFLAFGAVVIIAGMILIVMLVSALAEERKREIGTMRAVGSKRGQVARLFVFEGTVLSSVSSLIGTFVGVGVAFVCIYLTNTYWPNIVEGNVVTLNFTAGSLAVGFAVGFVIALVTFALSSYAISRMGIVDALRQTAKGEGGRRRRALPIVLIILGILSTLAFVAVEMDDIFVSFLGLIGPVLVIMVIPLLLSSMYKRIGIVISAAVAILYTVFFNLNHEASGVSYYVLFFVSGFILVGACTLAVALNLSSIAASVRWLLSGLRGRTSVVTVALLNPVRRVGRTALSIATFALVIFTLVALSANILGQQTSLNQAIEEQSGGYDVLGETSTSIRFDLGNSTARTEEGMAPFPNGTSVSQFLSFGSIGGTCSNLNKELPPRLIGANGSFIQENQFGFSAGLYHDKDDAAGIWSDLDLERADGAIPAIGDYNTVVWILQKDLDDYVEMVDESGKTRSLVIVGILQNSIVPGSMFISEDNINSMYPTKAEYNLFLFKSPEPSISFKQNISFENIISFDIFTITGPSATVSYLESELGSYGMDARPVSEVVEENLAIEWSYMSLFQSLLVFGLLVGTAGLALRVTKAVAERRNEIGILRALGFTKTMIMKVFLIENSYIALLGIAIGSFAGMLVSLMFFGPGSDVGYGAVVPWTALIAIALVVLIASLISAALPSLRAARMEPVEALRIHE
ncbi:MAG: FtsX-like permease family protein [Thermoplasmata archaeon]|nr:FtsX-like permease family protein [Thermoplasmata archaeon]